MLDAAEMTSMRADVAAAACDLPVLIQRSQVTYPTPGNAVVTWPTISPTGLLCGMKEPNAGLLTNYEYMIGDAATWHVQFPYATDVKELDRLVITEPNGFVRTLSVAKYLAPRSYSTLESVLATE